MKFRRILGDRKTEARTETRQPLNCEMPARGDEPSPPRFMESEHLPNADVSWSREPLGIPLIRPAGTFSPTGEKDGMRGFGSWVASTRFSRALWAMNQCPGQGASLRERRYGFPATPRDCARGATRPALRLMGRRKVVALLPICRCAAAYFK
jgi:hypothetical protein